MNGSKSSIGVVTISYNQARYLGSCLNSVGTQLSGSDMHVIVDPGSSDGSKAIIADYVARDPLRRKFVFEPDSGPADGLNKAFNALDTTYCCYLNSDDLLVGGAIDWVRRFFDAHPSVDILLGAIKICDECGNIRTRGRVPDYPSIRRLLSGSFQYFQQGTFFNLDVFMKTGGFNSVNRTSWDRELLVDMVLAGGRCYVTSKPLGIFRLHATSITGKGNNAIQYKTDCNRLIAKVRVRSGRCPSPTYSFLMKIEGRLNPFRWLSQLRPIK